MLEVLWNLVGSDPRVVVPPALQHRVRWMSKPSAVAHCVYSFQPCIDKNVHASAARIRTSLLLQRRAAREIGFDDLLALWLISGSHVSCGGKGAHVGLSGLTTYTWLFIVAFILSTPGCYTCTSIYCQAHIQEIGAPSLALDM